MLSARFFSIVVVFTSALSPCVSLAQSNERIMTDAARLLEWDYNNRAFLLIKQETSVATVAIIFGYADNEAACVQIADVLSEPRSRSGTFSCAPIDK